jgi:hypothetical protein
MKNKCDASNNRGSWNYFKIIHKIQGGSNMTGTNCDLFTQNQSRSYLNHLVPKKHARKERNQGTTENSHTGQGTRTSESTNVKVQ